MENEVGVAIEVAESAEAVVRGSDLLVTVTTAKEPIIKPEWLSPVSTSTPSAPIVPTRVRSTARLWRAPKSWSIRARRSWRSAATSCWHRKRKAIGDNMIHAEIGEVLAGAKPGRSSADEITLYKSVGIAIQDVAAAHLVYRKALERNVGSHVEI